MFSLTGESRYPSCSGTMGPDFRRGGDFFWVIWRPGFAFAGAEFGFPAFAILRRRAVSIRMNLTLEAHGVKESAAGIGNKLSRGTFMASWFLAVVATLELEGVRLEDL